MKKCSVRSKTRIRLLCLEYFLLREIHLPGGHRLEPGLMGQMSMASFSDAHECEEIPIIAANLHWVIAGGVSGKDRSDVFREGN